MTIKDNEFADISTATGPMRTYLFRPTAPGRYPGILLYSEIFQVTGPIRPDCGPAGQPWIRRRGARDLS